MTWTRRDWMLSLGVAALCDESTARVDRRGSVASAPAPRPTAAEAPDSGAFFRAVEAGDLGEVRRWLARRPEFASARDTRGLSAFVRAALAGRPNVTAELRDSVRLDIVEAVLAADWDAVAALAAADPTSCNALHPIGGTPLYAAALAGSLEQWRLRSAGCRNDVVPAGGTGFTPARGAIACRTISGAFRAATELLGNGSDVNAAQHGGDSILHGAVRRQSELLVRLAIRKGADPTARDHAGVTPAELADSIGWSHGARLLAEHTDLPRDHRASRWLQDADRAPVVRPDLTDVPQERQNEITAAAHDQLTRLREWIVKDERLVFSVSSADELAIEACAHTGNRDIMRFLLEHGSPLSLPTATALCDHTMIRHLLDLDPRLIHERGAHDFPVMWYVALGGGDIATAELLHGYGVSPDQESLGVTTLHWCVQRDQQDLATWLIEHGADLEALGFKWDQDGQTPLQLARAGRHAAMATLLEQAGARR